MTKLVDIDKKAVIAAAIEALTTRSEAMRASAEQTRKAATHAEAKPENDKDTRGLEQSYLARGQAMRVEALEDEVARLRVLDLRAYGDDDPIGLGALVHLAVDEEETTHFVAPVAGGTKVKIDDVDVVLVTPAAPLGRALMGVQVGDDFVLKLKGRDREVEVVDVC